MTQVHGTVETEFMETKIGLIPADWDVVRLADTVEFSRKPRSLDLSMFEMIPFVPMEFVPDEGVFVTQYEPREPDNIRSGSYCERGDILLAKITPSFENGKQGVLDNIPLEFAYATTEVYAIHPIPGELDRLFLFHFLRLPRVRTEIAGQMEGTTGRQRVPKNVVEDYLLPLPPLPEQRRIAAVLNAIQEDIAAQEDVIAEAREFKRSLMQRLFTYGPGAQPAVTRNTEIGEIPAHWEVVEFEETCEFLQYGTSQRCDYEVEGNPVLRIPNVVGGEIDASDLKYTALPAETVDTLRLEIGDLLFVRTNGNREYSGRSAVYGGYPHEALFASYLIRARLKSDNVLPVFIQAYTELPMGKRFLSGRALETADGKFNINMNTIGTMLVPVAPIEEQHGIVDMLQQADAKIAVEEDRKAALQDLFKATLHQLMTGQVRLLSDEGIPL